MKTVNNELSKPSTYTTKIKNEFSVLIDHLRDDVRKIDEPQAKALFGVAAEVVEGLKKAVEDYEKKNEPAWQAEGVSSIEQ
jgi:hypothetical protein